MLADEHDVDAVCAQAAQIVGRANATLSNDDAGVLKQLRKPHRMLDGSLHRPQVAIVDSKKRVARVRETNDVHRAQQMIDIVHLEERSHAQLGGENLKVDDVALGDGLGDEEDRIGTSGARFPDLINIDDEILAKHGQLDRVANHVDVFELAAEVMLVGETGDRAGTVGGVGLGNGDGVEVLADHSRGRAFALDLSDDMGQVGMPAVDQRLKKVAWSAQLRDALLKNLERNRLAGASDLDGFSRDDVLQDRVHRSVRAGTFQSFQGLVLVIASFIDIPATLLQSKDEVGGGVAAVLLVGVLAIGAITAIVGKGLWKCPAQPIGRVPRDPAIGGLAMMIALVIGSVAGAGAAGAAASMGIDDEAYARLAAGVAGNMVQVAIALLALQVVTQCNGTTPAAKPARAIGAGVLAFLLVAPVVAGVSIAINAMLVALGFPKAPETSHETLRILIERHDTLLSVLTLAHVALLVPIAEEALWRGLLQPALRRAGLGGFEAVLATATLFALIHWSVVPAEGRAAGLAMLFTLALALGILRERTGGIIAPIALHALFNAANVALALASAADVPVSSPP
jgi:membrane protease YdiL (CAAX protease family)